LLIYKHKFDLSILKFISIIILQAI